MHWTYLNPSLCPIKMYFNVLAGDASPYHVSAGPLLGVLLTSRWTRVFLVLWASAFVRNIVVCVHLKKKDVCRSRVSKEPTPKLIQVTLGSLIVNIECLFVWNCIYSLKVIILFSLNIYNSECWSYHTTGGKGEVYWPDSIIIPTSTNHNIPVTHYAIHIQSPIQPWIQDIIHWDHWAKGAPTANLSSLVPTKITSTYPSVRRNCGRL